MKLMLGLTARREAAVNANNANGETPLYLALCGDTAAHERIAKMLVARGATAVNTARDGDTPLHACARQGNLPLARTLLLPGKGGRAPPVSGAESLNARSKKGSTPLLEAVCHGQRQVTDLLPSPTPQRPRQLGLPALALHAPSALLRTVLPQPQPRLSPCPLAPRPIPSGGGAAARPATGGPCCI